MVLFAFLVPTGAAPGSVCSVRGISGKHVHDTVTRSKGTSSLYTAFVKTTLVGCLSHPFFVYTLTALHAFRDISWLLRCCAGARRHWRNVRVGIDV